MTEREESAIRELSQEVRTTNRAVADLTLSLVKHMAEETTCRRDVCELRLEVFGMDADPTKPGLKGRRDRLEQLRSEVGRRLSWGWALLVAGVGAFVGAIAKHFYP